ncbi:MAG TPA: helix-turn-helix transcriptional regulator [Methylomirabilota bacterium]|nr:helix-turn-helix transcriptional regulator [Methylomirabilota bacterium]
MVGLESEDVVGRVYEAVANPDLWPLALTSAAEVLGADAMLLLYCNLSVGRPQVIASPGFDGDALERFAARHLDHDELVRESMQLPVGVVVSRTYSIEDSRTRTTVFRRTLAHVSDRIQIAGAAAIRDSEVYASLWMARSQERPPFSGRDMHLFSKLLPHVGRAMSVHHRVASAELEASLAAGAIDRIAIGMVLFDATDQVILTNREADRIFESDDGLSLTDRHVFAASSDASARLRRVIREVGRAGSEGAKGKPVGGAAIRIARSGGRPPYNVVVLPLPRRCQPRDAAGAVAVAFITDPEPGQMPVDVLCGDLFELTAAEVRLVSTLLGGSGLTAAAKTLGLSRNTVHSQLASVFQKTGTKSQGELLRLILGGIAPVKAPDESSGFRPAFRKTDDSSD